MNNLLPVNVRGSVVAQWMGVDESLVRLLSAEEQTATLQSSPSALQLFLLYHSCETARRMHLASTPYGPFTLRPLNLGSSSLQAACGLQPSARLQLADFDSFYRTPLGHSYQNMLAENAAVVSLGFRARRIAGSSCQARRCWIGSASWKAIAPSSKNFHPACQNLDEFAPNSSLLAAQLDALPERATLYWFGREQYVRWKSDTNLHLRQTDRRMHLARFLRLFFDETLGLDFDEIAAGLLTPPSGHSMPWPWANWWLAPPDVAEDMAKLHALLYGWLEARWPMQQGCNATFWGVAGRCWAYVGEELSLVYLTTETDLHHIGCGQRPTPYVQESRDSAPAARSQRRVGGIGPITVRLRERWTQAMAPGL